MGKKDFELNITYKDVFSFERLLSMIVDWLTANSYIGNDCIKDDKYMETYFLEKRTIGGKDIVFWWDTQRKGTNVYFRRKLLLDFKTLGLNKVELIKEGQKIKAEKGELSIKLKGVLLWGEDIPEFQTAPKSLLKEFQKIFEAKIYDKEIKKEFKAFESNVEELRLAIKQYLDTKGFVQEFRSFHPQNP